MNTQKDITVALLIGAFFGFGLGFVAAMVPMNRTVEDLQRKAVASRAAYWKPDPGTGKPVLVWAREGEDR